MFGGGYVPVDLPPAPKVTCESLQAAMRLKHAAPTAQEEDDLHPVAPQPTAPFGLASHREVLEHLRDAIFVLDRVDADGAQIFCVAVGDAYTAEGELRVTLSRVYLDDEEQWTLWGDGRGAVDEEHTVAKMTGAYLVSRCPPHVIDVASVAARYHDGDEAEWTGPWTADEHQEFLNCLDIFGEPIFVLEWNKFADRIKTRSVAQIRKYAREHFDLVLKKTGSDALDSMDSPLTSAERAHFASLSPAVQEMARVMVRLAKRDLGIAPVGTYATFDNLEDASLGAGSTHGRRLRAQTRAKPLVESFLVSLAGAAAPEFAQIPAASPESVPAPEPMTDDDEPDAAAAPQLGRSLQRVARADFENWLADRKVRWRAARGHVEAPRVMARRGVSVPPRPRGPFVGVWPFASSAAACVAVTKRPTTRGASAAHAAVRREITALCHEMTEAVDLLVSPQLARQEIRALCRSMTEEVEHLVEPAAANYDESEEAPEEEEAGGHKCEECGRCFDKEKGLETHKALWCTGGNEEPVPSERQCSDPALAALTRTELRRVMARRGVGAPSRPGSASRALRDRLLTAKVSTRASGAQRSDAAPPPDESSDDEAAAIARVVGWRASLGRNSRVWALFEPDVWWGGTIISISGAEDKRACSIVFDDATSQTFYARDVWQRPPAGGKVGARSPNAAARAAIKRASSTAAEPVRSELTIHATGVTRCTSGRPNCYCKSGRTRAVVRYDLETGEDLEEYCSQMDAERKLNVTNVANVLGGRAKTTGGHAFRYKAAPLPSRSGDLSTPRPKPRKRPRRGSPDADPATRIRRELLAFLPAHADYLADIAPSAAARASSLAELAALPADALDAVLDAARWKKLKANALRRHLARFRDEHVTAASPEPAPPAPRVTPVAPSGNCPICYETLSADATVFECSHAMCASCSDSYAKSEVKRSMGLRSGVSVACPLCRAPSKVGLPAEMHASLPMPPPR